MTRPRRIASVAICAGFVAGCGGDPPSAPTGWQPGVVLPSEHAGPRGQLELRGLIHAHSVFSHDACDGNPRDEATGALNLPCLDDFRRALCSVGHDFVFLTDHGGHFAEYEFPEVLLFDAARGDELVSRKGEDVANFAACAGSAQRTLILAGTETKTMPVGLERHVGATPEERQAAYSGNTKEAVLALKQNGAVTLVAHTEEWTVEELTELGLQGFEMFNLHANTIIGAGGVFALLGKLAYPELLPHPDLAFLPIVSEDARYLEKWGTVLARGGRPVTTMGTDCHQNTLPEKLPDGERIDSYRRMMGWFSNHLLVTPEPGGAFDDQHLKRALADARLFGVFEMLGFPAGFDYVAASGSALVEIGGEASLAAQPELIVKRPHIRDLASTSDAPEISLRILRAIEGGFDAVAESVEPGETELVYKPTQPGAYRAEVRMRPRHLRAHLGSFSDFADADFVWIYSNAIHVVR
ncbi:MAG: hypothetical protein EXR75_02560 [Myxococcales bacterium]|nr:hypothetical protein [Myxococcales bacterium]